MAGAKLTFIKASSSLATFSKNILQKVSNPNLSQIWRPDRSFTTLLSQMEELKVINQQPKNVVLYHYPCPDGIFAALAAHLYHTAVVRPVTFLPNTVYDPIRVEDVSTENVETFYLLDFAGPQEFAVELAKRAKRKKRLWVMGNTLTHICSVYCTIQDMVTKLLVPVLTNKSGSKHKRVVVLDHHKTALETLPPSGTGPANLHVELDMTRSGATIAYDYFLQKLQAQSSPRNLVEGDKITRVETLFKYIEDADLWTWALPDSKAFSSGLSDSVIEYSVQKNSSVFDQLLELDAQTLIAKGQASLLEKQRLIDQVLDNSFVVQLGQGKFGQCLGVRADSISNLRSALGNQLAAKSRDAGLRPIGAVVYVEEALKNDNMFKISLRSIGNDDDTTAISQAYGGGGHRNASSFLLPADEFEYWKGSKTVV